MASLIEAIDIKRKAFFEHEGAPYVCLDVEVSKLSDAPKQEALRQAVRIVCLPCGMGEPSA